MPRQRGQRLRLALSVNSSVPTRRIGSSVPADVGIMIVVWSSDGFSCAGTLKEGSTG